MEQDAIIDWSSRRVLAWRLSNTLTTDFCLYAVREALHRHGRPEILNTDQGCQFTSTDFTDLLKDNGIRISMDGKRCRRDNVFVERLWKSVKYEEVYLKAYDSVAEAKAQLGAYLRFYNERRPHRTHDGRTPDQAYVDALGDETPLATCRRNGGLRGFVDNALRAPDRLPWKSLTTFPPRSPSPTSPRRFL